MESNEEPIMLTNPNINFSDLPYLKEDLEKTKINLFKINLKKDIIIYQYSFLIEPEINNKGLFFQSIKKTLINIYCNLYFIHENNIYSTKEINYNLTIRNRIGENDYLIHIYNSNYIKLNNDNLYTEIISKEVIEMLISDILKSNYNIKLNNNIYFDRKKEQYFLNHLVYFNTGYLFKFVTIKNECFLNLSFIKKIYSNYGQSENYIKEIRDPTYLEIIKNKFFEYIKQENNINEFIDMLTNSKESKEKYEKYGIEILPITKIIKSYYIKPPLSKTILSNKNNSQISKPTEINNWIFIYHIHNYN